MIFILDYRLNALQSISLLKQICVIKNGECYEYVSQHPSIISVMAAWRK